MNPRPNAQKIKLDKFKQLFYEESLSNKEIASYFDVSISAIGSIRRRYNLPPRGWSNGIPPRTGSKMDEKLKKRLSIINKGKWLGSKNPNWIGGRRINTQGYVLLLKPEHPFHERHGYVREHRYVMEQKIGRFLDPKEVVHHINRNKQDNRIENLVLISSNSEHRKLHNDDAIKHLRKTPSHIKHFTGK